MTLCRVGTADHQWRDLRIGPRCGPYRNCSRPLSMNIRPTQPIDLDRFGDIDATVDSGQYLHVDRSGEGLELAVKVRPRNLREKLVRPYPLGDDLQFSIRQIAAGIVEGLALVAEHDDGLVAALTAQRDHAAGVIRLLDLRVDIDRRRQGIASVMMYQLIEAARTLELRAVAAATQANNFPASQMLAKMGFELAGLDTFALSNHDLVKEAVTLLWYFPIG